MICCKTLFLEKYLDIVGQSKCLRKLRSTMLKKLALTMCSFVRYILIYRIL